MKHLGKLAVLAALAGGCAAQVPQPSAGPANALPPTATAPEGVLGDAAVGATSLADPAIETMGDPFL